jgi:hypothetical protein
MFIYYFNIILILLKTDILAFQEIINDKAPLTIEIEVDDNIKEVERFLDKYEQENINIPYERPYRNIKLMVKLLLRDFKIL